MNILIYPFIFIGLSKLSLFIILDENNSGFRADHDDMADFIQRCKKLFPGLRGTQDIDLVCKDGLRGEQCALTIFSL
jgi:hypothetical protein